MSDLSEIANYEIIRRIGEGGYGTVYLAKLKNRAEYLALKIIASKGIERERKALEKYLNISDLSKKIALCLSDVNTPNSRNPAQHISSFCDLKLLVK